MSIGLLKKEEPWLYLLLPLTKLALSAAVAACVELAAPLITLYFVGHHSKEALAGLAVGFMVSNATCFAPAQGFSVAADNFCASAFGAGQLSLVGRSAQRMAIVMTIFCLPVGYLWWNIAPVLHLLGIEASVVLHAQQYLRALMPSIWPFFMFDLTRRYFQAQMLTLPVTITSTLVSVLQVPISYYFVEYLQLATYGAGVAVGLSYWGMLFWSWAITWLLYMLRRRCPVALCACLERLPSTWPSIFSWELLQNWGALAAIGMPACLSLVVEWGSFEINTAISARVGVVALATHGIYVQMASAAYCIPFGLALGSATLGTVALGAGDAVKAQRLMVISLVGCSVFGLCEGLLCVIFRDQLGALFTRDADVIAATSQLAPMFMLYALCDCVKCSGTVFIRNTGRPGITAIAGCVGCIFVGFPTSISLGLHRGYGLAGVWFGMSVAWGICAVWYLIVLSRTNWAQQVQEIASRTENYGSCGT